jgi:Ca2+-binding EF-hand superfamily protein
LGDKYDKTQRHKLFDYIDLDKNGKITFDVSFSLSLSLSWKLYVNLIAVQEFVQAFIVSDNMAPKWEEYVLQQIYTSLHKSQTQLARVFKMMDTDNSGKLDVQEFQQVICHKC